MGNIRPIKLAPLCQMFSFITMDVRWRHPFTCIISGPTSSGKSVFSFRMIEHAREMINPQPEQVLYSYGEYQKVFNDYPHVTFIEGLPDINQFDGTRRTLLIVDDQMGESDDNVCKIFTKISHHRNVSIIFITQNIFYKSKHSRTMSLNSHYIVLFKSVRDTTPIHVLSRQMYPRKSKFLIEAFLDATREPYGYLLLDLRPDTDDAYRIRTRIFPSDERQYVYLPK